ncbi:MAG TPA: rhomboid family intramembrane serine protease [Candidatus Binatia bacterium]|nr:rhomboid family intramembrane serine protease [Candidatus Binatia bacterium]
MLDESERIVRIAGTEALARDWELVLLSQGLSPQLRVLPDGVALAVPRAEVEAALAGLAAYDKENAPEKQRATLTSTRLAPGAGALAASSLFFLFVLTDSWNSVPWLERGSANAAKILVGELWRTVTALTLHGDIAHALANAFAVAVFFSALAGQLGAGLAALLILAAGGFGNLANAYLQGPPHNAVGASTAIFAAVGMLGGLGLVRRRRAKESGQRSWIMIAASLALLGMLGSSGAGVDVLAHFLGFFAGILLGTAVGLCLPVRPGVTVQWFCGSATLAVLVCCWFVALQ